jgi:hypothetical protein
MSIGTPVSIVPTGHRITRTIDEFLLFGNFGPHGLQVRL